MLKKLEGYKTYIGIVVLAIGATGLSNIITPEQFEDVVEAIFKIVGVAIAVYGNYHAHQRLKEV